MVFIAKVLLAALVIAFASWLSGKNLSSQVLLLPCPLRVLSQLHFLI